MAKKDLLERISTTPDGLARRSEGGEQARPADLVQTRVSGQVVRRRRKEDEEPAAPPQREAPRTVVRRRVIEPAEAAPKAEPVARAEAPEPVRPAPVEAAPTPAPEPPPVAVAAPVAEPPAPKPEPARVEAPPAPAPEPVKVEAPAPKPEPAREPVRAEPPAPVRAEPPAPRPEPEPPPAPTVPDQPRFQGLGIAVVRPPPDYDPTNPNTWRRDRSADRPDPRGGPTAAPPSGGTEDDAARGRRRVAQPGFADRSRGRNTGRNAGPPSGGGAPGGGGGPGGSGGRRSRTMANDGGMGGPMRRTRRRTRSVGAPKAASPAPKAIKRKIRVDNVISVGELAHQLGVKAAVVIKELMKLGKMATVNEMLDVDTATLVANEFEYTVENVGFQENDLLQTISDETEEEGQQERPPVVTIMGHVDHGKTTLLDAIRDARVASGEAGGITQHIGAYQVTLDEDTITFIDTPGHAAFTEMRARGAMVTDIVVLVVAADDGVQPQTLEAISHAKAAGVPIVVAINKMDKPGVNPDQIKSALSDHGLQPEEWGGETLYAYVSALKKEGIEDLLESILLQSEILDLRANPDRYAEGIVIESKMERGRGPVASVLVQRGTLHRGDVVVLGGVFGKVRNMVDWAGNTIKEAGPSTPVEIFGLSDLPMVGDPFTVAENEKNAKAVAEHRLEKLRQDELARHRRRTAEDLFASAKGEKSEVLNIVLKADVNGSLQALRGALEKIQVDGTELNFLHAGVGAISENDVNLVAVNSGMLVGFNVKCDPNARRAADSQGVEPELYTVIYDVIDQVTARLNGMVAPEYEPVQRATVEIRAVFKISRVGSIAGCMVTDGTVTRSNIVKVMREGKQIWEGKIGSLKRFKDDVREVQSGYECGIALDGFNDVQEGDILLTFSMELKKRV